MKHIILASTNRVKVQATFSGFQLMFPGEHFEITPVTIESGVRCQPLSSYETLQGAINRARNAFATMPNADYWVGIEGGGRRARWHHGGAFLGRDFF